jgi:hypothetical protein
VQCVTGDRLLYNWALSEQVSLFTIVIAYMLHTNLHNIFVTEYRVAEWSLRICNVLMQHDDQSGYISDLIYSYTHKSLNVKLYLALIQY